MGGQKKKKEGVTRTGGRGAFIKIRGGGGGGGGGATSPV